MMLVYEFENFKQEHDLIGQMLIAYGELEFDLANVMHYAIPDGKNTAARIIFRVNGEAARLDVADAILRPFFEKLNLVGQWSNALGALRFCKNIRNQYAHCNWHVRQGTGELCFINLERDADSSDDTLNVQLYPTDLRLLQKQHQYFHYTLVWLWHLHCECRRKRGDKDVPSSAAPKSIPQPPLHNLPKNTLQSQQPE